MPRLAESYVELHSTDHQVVETISARIGNAFEDGPYVLRLPAEIRMGWKDRTTLISLISEDILKHADAIRSGSVVGNGVPIPWEFRRMEPDEVEPWEPQRGIKWQLSLGSIFDRYAERNENSFDEIESKLDLLLRSAEGKFERHTNAVTVLLLVCHTDEILLDFDSVKAMVERRTPTPAIDQIWIHLPPLDEFDDDDAWYALLL